MIFRKLHEIERIWTLGGEGERERNNPPMTLQHYFKKKNWKYILAISQSVLCVLRILNVRVDDR